MEIFSHLVGLFMQHRRKMLKAIVKFATGDLAKVNWDKLFEQCGIDPQKRPENLRPEDFICIANLCYETIRKKRQ